MDNDPKLQLLRDAAARHRQSLLDIGRQLLELSKEGYPLAVLQEQILRDEYNISISTSTVALRWAMGDYGEDAERVVNKIRHSELAHMSVDTLNNVKNSRHSIRADDGKVRTKLLDQMSKREASRNITRIGVVPIGKGITSVPRFRSVTATRVEIDDNGHIVFVADLPEVIRVRVSKKVLDQAMDMLELNVECA